jgi:drug/metabolite transporter (DMT)-like permease
MVAMSDAALPLPSRAPLPASRGKQWEASVALVVAAFFFGTTFVVVQDAIEEAKPLAFLAVRFLVAAAVLGVVARRRPASHHEVRHGVIAGLALLGGYVFQTIGLQYTTPATSAFITYLLVAFVPILAFVLLRRRSHPATLVGIVLALGGLVLLTSNGEGGPSLGKGEVLTLGCAVMFALHIVIVGETAQRHDPVRFTFVQLTTVGAVCAGWCLLSGNAADLAIGDAVWAAMFTGVFATAVAFLAMVWAQQVVTPSRAALILLMEPVFAAFLGWVTGDRLTWMQACGSALILLAVIVSEVVPKLLTGRSRSVRLEFHRSRRGMHGRSEEAESTFRPLGPP